MKFYKVTTVLSPTGLFTEAEEWEGFERSKSITMVANTSRYGNVPTKQIRKSQLGVFKDESGIPLSYFRKSTWCAEEDLEKTKSQCEKAVISHATKSIKKIFVQGNSLIMVIEKHEHKNKKRAE